MAGPTFSVLFIAIVGGGSAYFALRDSPSKSRMKIMFACLLVLGFLFVLAGTRWIVGKEDLSGVTLVIWPLAAIGILTCLSSIAGKLIGIHWRKNRF